MSTPVRDFPRSAAGRSKGSGRGQPRGNPAVPRPASAVGSSAWKPPPPPPPTNRAQGRRARRLPREPAPRGHGTAHHGEEGRRGHRRLSARRRRVGTVLAAPLAAVAAIVALIADCTIEVVRERAANDTSDASTDEPADAPIETTVAPEMSEPAGDGAPLEMPSPPLQSRSDRNVHRRRHPSWGCPAAPPVR